MKNNKKSIDAPAMVEQSNSMDNVRNGRPVNLRSADWLASKENEINAAISVDGAAVKLEAAYDYADTEDTAVYYDGELTTGNGSEVVPFECRRIGWLSSKLGLPTNPRTGSGLKSLVNCTEEELEKIASQRALKDLTAQLKACLVDKSADVTDKVADLCADALTNALAALHDEQAQQKANLENKQRNKSVATASNDTMIAELLRRGLITEEQAAAMRAAAA